MPALKRLSRSARRGRAVGFALVTTLAGAPPIPAVLGAEADSAAAPRAPAEDPRTTRPALPAAAPAASFPAEILLQADEQRYDQQLGRFVASGRVQAALAGGRLQADRLEYATASRTLYASGSIRFQRGNQYLQASRLRFNLSEGSGELDDVYGVLDSDTSAQDLRFDTAPALPLGDPQPMACPPLLPAIPEWHPYPWSLTAWGGQMVDAEFGDTFLFRGTARPEFIGGIGLQRRLIDGGPFALEFDTNLIGHKAWSQPGGGFNQSVPYATNPAQSFGEITAGIGLRAWLQPWLSLLFVEGVSFTSEVSDYERTFRENYAQLLNYLAVEVEALVSPRWSLVGRIHHRSGAYGVYSGVREGSNGYLAGLRYRFGQQGAPARSTLLPPPQGCPGSSPAGPDGEGSLAEQLEPRVLAQTPTAQPQAAAPPAPKLKGRDLWQRARQQEREREAAINRIDQRVSEVTFEQSLTAQRRFGIGASQQSNNQEEDAEPEEVNRFGSTKPVQLQDLNTRGNRRLLSGTISRWRFQAARIRISNDRWSADRVGFTNDPYTPAQSWLDAEDVVARQLDNGDTVVEAKRNRILLEDRLPIPVNRKQRFRKEEVENRLVVGVDGEDRDGFYLGYNLAPIRIGAKGSLELQPQFLAQRAIDGSTDSYPLPGQSPGDSTTRQPATTGDMFGLLARLDVPVAGFQGKATLDISSFNPDNLSNATRSWGTLERDVALPLLGDSKLSLFGAYRYKVWNGTLGQQDVYSAYGVSLEDQGNLPDLGKLTNTYFWRLGFGNYQANTFESDNLQQLWRGNLYASLNSSLPLWRGKPAPDGPNQALRNSPVPIVPGLTLNTNLNTSLAYYSDGINQNTLSLSAGPTLTLGRFTKPFLDYTQLTITGGGTLRQGVSPLGFDRAVDLGTLGFGLTQQIAGPLVFSGGIGFNVDPNSQFYGDVTNSFIELRWQRRAYEIGFYYSPYEQLGGLRVRLNDFNFKGTGVPFVPYDPQQRFDPRQRPF